MSQPQQIHTQGNIVGNMFGYIPAVLKEYSAGWRIEYYVKNPITGEFTRRQEKVQHYVNRLGKREARAYLRNAVNQINLKLSQGWSPFFVQEDSRLYEPLANVVTKFQKEKEKELRPNTMRSYKSITNEILRFAQGNYPGITASTFNRNIAIRFMDTILEKNRSNTHYNNIRKVATAFFNWSVEKCYAKENPFEKIKSKPKEQKTRIIVTTEVKKQIAEELGKTGNIGVQIMINLVYQSLLRPKEVAEIQIKDVFLDEKYILVPASVAKNHNERKATMSNHTIKLLKCLHIEKYPKDFYLLGGNIEHKSNNGERPILSPSHEKAGNRRYQTEWNLLRQKLKFPKEMQLYSLRDTGITDMLKSGIDNLTVMQHADHSSLDITSRYAKHVDTGLVKKMNPLLPKF